MRLSALCHKLALTLTSVGVALAAFTFHTPEADACGCVAPPDPTVPVVQNAERIAFAMEDGQVVAHIQIQYEGAADEFAWLVPVPAIPDMEVGTDELFAQLIAQTQPLYVVNREYEGNCGFDPSRGLSPNAGSSDDFDSGGGEQSPPPADPGSPLILRATTGPYDYAVLSAANKDAMLDWLQDEEFFVPAGTESVVDPYINPNAYFLALKLRPGASEGDLQPIVVRYDSNMPMIPLILTSVAANPDMGILVWVLGDSRAIPRNYFHTVLNDAAIDWLNAAQNYISVLTDAVDESDGHHSFVTEYAGTSEIMVDLLDPEWRFGDLEELAAITDGQQYLEYLTYNGYTVLSANGPFFGPQYSSQLISILESHMPVPAALLEYGVTPNDYYVNISYYLGWFRDENPELFQDLDLEFNAPDLTSEIEERVVKPTREAGRMFRENPYMTRMFTTLSPHEMNRDPVFSFNDNQLPDVSNRHEATLTYHCGLFSADRFTTPATLVTEQGWTLELPNGEGSNDWTDVSMPGSELIQILREEGGAQNVTDNKSAIDGAINDFRPPRTGCSIAADGGADNGLALLLLGFVGILVTRRRRDRV